MEESLRETEVKLRAILQSAFDAIIIIDEHGAIESFNPAAEKMFGYSAGDLSGKNINLLMPSPFREEHDHYLQHYLATDERRMIGTNREVAALRKDGSVFPVELTINEIRVGQQRWFSGILRDITERKREKTRYLQKTSELQAIFDTFSDLFFRIEADSAILDYHIGRAARFPIFTEKLLGKKSLDVFPQELRSQYQQAIEEVVATGRPLKTEFRLPTAEKVNVFEVRLTPFLKKQVIVVIRDITERSAAEEIVRQSEMRYHALAEVLPVGIFRTDPAGLYVYVNERWCDIANLQPEETYGKGWAQAVHPDDRIRVFEFWNKAIRDKLPFKAEFRFKHRDGVIAWVFAQAVVETGRDGEATGYIGTITDITDRIRADEALRKAHLELEMRVEERTADLRATNRWLRQMITERRQAEIQLREERNFISAILETAGALIVVYDADGRIVRFNRGCQETTGYTFQEVNGRLAWDVFMVADEVELARAAFLELKEGKLRNEYETYWLTKSGEKKLISWSATALRGADGLAKYVIGTGIDVTDSRKAEEESRQHQAELAHFARLCTMGEMATGLAHELNQPLAAIVSYTQGCVRRLLAGNDNSNQLLEAMQQVTRQAQRAGEIIRRMRNFVSKGEPQRASVHINDILSEVVGMAKIEIKKNNVAVKARLAEHLPSVSVDMIQIEQVVLNLIRNAIEAMGSTEPAARSLTITTAKTADRMIEVAISDTGEGLPGGDPDKVFDPFFTTKKDGMGMGLAISRSLIEAHGGKLWAERNSDRGTTFRFTLPI